jgi:hypothetical protein
MFFCVALIGVVVMAWLGVETRETPLEKLAT